MTSNELKSIEKIASSVFSCLEKELKTFITSYHRRFPIDCCDIASGLLYVILQEEGFCNCKLIRGHDPRGQSHVWVENENFIIDLTSHQFHGFHGPLILISKDEYPLNKPPYYSVTETMDLENWEYFELLVPYFFESFYNDYYKKAQNKND
ncbi:hypothetical protein [Acinetobacter oleivorans]|uniref:hypothetical protein n=1 Tax=Acinetobacter oleivorans TaxID=1148157 RepID=UPI00124FFEED|nr:hypothetical protein [Acinetobacter oleivorans]